MKAIKLTKEEFQRSINAKKIQHLWLYSKYNTSQRPHNNGIFMFRTSGVPSACIVSLDNYCFCDEDIEATFGKGYFIEGGPSNDEIKNLLVPAYYVK